ncbi:MAG: hypothetical protein AAFR46_12625 [Pseudomonadota bacterium]
MTRLLLLIAMTGLAACATTQPTGGVVYNTDFDRVFSLNVRLGGVQDVEFYGTAPNGLAPQGFADLMRTPGWYPPTQFRAVTPDPDPRGYYFVTSFGTDVVTPLCDRPRSGGDPRLVAMALCLDVRQISRAVLRIDESRPLEPQISSLMRSLLPPPRPDDTPSFRRRLRQ